MSMFLSLVIPYKSQEDKIVACAKKYGFYLDEVRSEFVEKQVNETLKYYFVDDDEHNTCLGVGSYIYDKDDKCDIEKDPIFMTLSYIRKQFKDNPIIYEALSNLHKENSVDLDAETKEIRELKNKNNIHLSKFINEIIDNQYCKKVGILLHFYKGNLYEERFNILDFIYLEKVRNLEKILPNIEFDKLYWIK